MVEDSIQIPVTCNRDCGGGCPLMATVADGKVTQIVDSPFRGPAMTGCVRGYNAWRALEAPDRLRKPLLRAGERGSGSFREAEWPEALDVVADRLATIRAEHGPQAILRLGGSGSCRGALHNTGTLAARFFNLFGGCTIPYGSYSSGAAGYTTPYVLGTTEAGIDPATLQHSKLIILWGANIVDCRLGCEWLLRLREAKARGVEIIVIDPRRTRTVRQLGTQWIPILPGTDSALMMALLHVLITEGMVDLAFVAGHSSGYEELKRHILGEDSSPAKTPAWAAALCGTPAETITALARRYGHTKPMALIPGLSYQRTWGGEEAVRLGIALQVATGNLGLLGGSSGALTWGRLPHPALNGIPIPPCDGPQPRTPVYQWPDAVLGGREAGFPSDIKAIYSAGSNLLVQGSDINKNIRAYQQAEFSVCHDLFLTPTTHYCDVVLPVTHYLERADIVFPDGNYLLYSNQAVTPPPQVKNDYDIFCELAARLGFGEAYSEGKDEAQWLQSFLAASEIVDHDAFRRTGIYLGQDQMRVGLADFRATPEAHPLLTPSGKIELASVAYARTGFLAIPTARILPADPAYPLRLVTPKSRYRVHSQNANLAWFNDQERPALSINPVDAISRGIAEGQVVRVTSPEGLVRVAAYVTEEIMPGVVCLLEGVWPTFAPDGADTAGSPNVLTSTTPTEPSQSSRTHSVLVEVSAG